MGSFDYVVIDNNQQVLALKSYTFDPNQVIEELTHLRDLDPILQYRYQNIRIAWSSGKSTLIPGRLFQENDKKAFLQQTAVLSGKELVKAEALSHNDLFNVYAITKQVEDWINTHFAGHRLFHLGSVLIENYHKFTLQHKEKQVFVHIVDTLAYFVVFKNDHLLFYNSFSYKSAKDFTYYLLLVFKQLELDQTQHSLFISGQLVKESEIYPLIHRYIKHISFLEAPAFLSFGSKMQEKAKYLYYGVLSLSITP
jgi:hypothetical protein